MVILVTPGRGLVRVVVTFPAHLFLFRIHSVSSEYEYILSDLDQRCHVVGKDTTTPR
jgi:hypothetical protein